MNNFEQWYRIPVGVNCNLTCELGEFDATILQVSDKNITLRLEGINTNSITAMLYKDLPVEIFCYNKNFQNGVLQLLLAVNNYKSINAECLDLICSYSSMRGLKTTKKYIHNKKYIRGDF